MDIPYRMKKNCEMWWTCYEQQVDSRYIQSCGIFSSIHLYQPCAFTLSHWKPIQFR